MDVTELILNDHYEQRRMFAMLDELGNDPRRLAPVWDRLATFLEVHAEAEERLFYPELLRVGRGAGGEDSSASETKDAIKDHNEIRAAIRRAAQSPTGSSQWWDAVTDARIANSDHIAEEEREDLADFRRHASIQERHDLAVQFAVFEASHVTGVREASPDPGEYVTRHSREL